VRRSWLPGRRGVGGFSGGLRATATLALVITKASSRVIASLALVAALSTSGCAVTSPVQTDEPYQPADGVNLNLGEGLAVRGLLVVGGEKKDEAGRLSGQLLNTSSDDVSVTFGTGSTDQTTATVPAHSSLNLADEELTLESVPAVAGDLVPLSISASSTGDNILQVPVLPATGYYEDLTP
jgi:hypothetical protein